MSNLDKYYRALTDYGKTTKPDRELTLRRGKVAKACAEKDVLRVTGYICAVDEEWVSAVETGLDFIGKAISEEKQFIRSSGEVMPIEKVKNVSRESVEHLSKHSNLITRAPEGGEVIPDGLYAVERLTDYAVYENRFLYMLLLFVRDFVSVKYEKIVGLSRTYLGEYCSEKSVDDGKRRTHIRINFKEEIKNDEYLKETNPVRDAVFRLDGILKTVNSYLKTPLMEFVAKAPLLKPPITETNVLKMNKNFKGAVRLYYYLCAYSGDGFTAEKNVQEGPPDERTADDFSEVGELLAFLTYEHGLKLEETLKARYDLKEAERLAEEEKKCAEKFENLRKRFRENGESAEEYALELEKRVRAMEKNGELLAAKEQEAEALKKRLDEAEQALKNRIGEHAAELESLKKEYGERFREQTAEHEKSVAAFNGEIEKLKSDLSTKDGQLKELGEEYGRVSNEKLVSEAKLNAVKKQYGLFTEADDFTTEENFNEIERQYNAFKTFFKEEWKKAKKRIRSDVSEK